jgi:hypothetical protein
MKIPESKRSEIRIIVEIRGIPNGFPNLDVPYCLKEHPISMKIYNLWLLLDYSVAWAQ